MWKQEPGVEADDREDRTWVIVRLPATNDLPPESALDAVSALIGGVNGMEQQYQAAAAQTEAAVRGWWARQQR
jgi:hypothetical protein